MSSPTLTPEVNWAQRSSDSDESKNFIYLTIMTSDVSNADMKLDLQPSALTFKGYSNSKKATYAVTLEFYAEIDPAQSKIHHSERDVEIKLQKKDLKAEYWPRLLKDAKKVHFLKTDFDKWVDEDEQDAVVDDEYMNQFGGAGAGMGGMGGMGGDGDFGGLDFSKLGGGDGKMPDMSSLGGMEGQSDMGEMGDDEEDDDEDMPALEDEDGPENSQSSTSIAGAGVTGASATRTSSKIEELE